jgi:ATP-dependent Clp protease ATP-binding subunit ClpA
VAPFGDEYRFVFDRFSANGERVFGLVRREAAALAHDVIGPEHLLLGLIEDERMGARPLDTLGVDVTRARADVIARLALRPAGEAPSSPALLAETTQHILDLSFGESQRVGRCRVGPEDMLLGLLADGDNPAAQILCAQGVDLDSARRQLWDQPGPSAQPAGVPSRAICGPRCSRCDQDLNLRVRDVDASADGESNPGSSRSVRVVYCRNCGATVAVFDVAIHLAPFPPRPATVRLLGGDVRDDGRRDY